MRKLLPKPKLRLRITFVMLMCVQVAIAQQQTISGKITAGKDGSPLPGVNVIIEGTTQGTTSDSDGSYKLEVPGSDAIVVFSFIGFTTQRVPVGNQTTIDVTMDEDLTTLQEVVVVGYSSQEKRGLTGAVATVSPKDFERVPATNPLEAFQGRMPGVQITNSNGLPGSGAQVRIRGIRSNSTSNSALSPVYVVDGVITDNIDGIAPLDIESVSVLKDASEASIYGARAANGVVIVQTKRGRQASKPEITFNMFGGIQGKSNRELEVLNAAQWLDLWTEAHENGGVTPNWDADDLADYEGVDTDWLGVMRQRGVLQNYNVGVSGSSELSNYYVSASYLNHKGVVVATDYDKYTLRFNSDHKIGKRLRFGNSLNINVSEVNGNGGEYELAARKVPLTRVFEDDGSWGRTRHVQLEHQHQNPLWRARNVVDNRQYKDILGNMYLTLNIIEGLDITARANVEWKHGFETDFSPGVDPAFLWEGSVRNFVAKRETQNMHWITDFVAEYKKTIGTDHNVKLLAGYSLEENVFQDLVATGGGTPNNDIRYLFATDPNERRVPDRFDGRDVNGID
ncbi:MAG TPA: SusC/RagA family TonB-linked outer membrane protein, partial [Chryseosolibacter sp.]|nr:SusC/RagA family TonB-linked outer membrane protein [Chryseosolibacter sp.]